MEDVEYTTEVVATVRFVIRHLEPMSKQEFMEQVLVQVLDYDRLYDDGDTPCLSGWSVISEEVENANTPLEE